MTVRSTDLIAVDDAVRDFRFLFEVVMLFYITELYIFYHTTHCKRIVKHSVFNGIAILHFFTLPKSVPRLYLSKLKELKLPSPISLKINGDLRRTALKRVLHFLCWDHSFSLLRYFKCGKSQLEGLKSFSLYLQLTFLLCSSLRNGYKLLLVAYIHDAVAPSTACPLLCNTHSLLQSIMIILNVHTIHVGR